MGVRDLPRWASRSNSALPKVGFALDVDGDCALFRSTRTLARASVRAVRAMARGESKMWMAAWLPSSSLVNGLRVARS